MNKSMEAKKTPKCVKKGLQAVWDGQKRKYEVQEKNLDKKHKREYEKKNVL